MSGSTASTETLGYSDLGPLIIHMHSGYLIQAALELGLAQQVDDAGTTVADLAERVQADPDSLRRLLQALSAIGAFQPAEGDRFQHTTVSAALRTAAQHGVLGTFLRDEWSVGMQHLTQAVRTGQAAFPQVMGKPFYDYLNQDAPQLAAEFHTTMTQMHSATNAAIVAALDLSATTELVDVGGGQGTMLRDLLRENPHLRGTLFDLGRALADVDADLRSGALAERCQIVEGDARQWVAAGADTYLFRRVLCDWDDASCVQMLASCAHNAASGARVLAADVVLPDEGDLSGMAAMLDLEVFTLFGGSERTTSQFAALLEQAGLDFLGVTDTSSEFSIIEARVR